MAKVTKDTMIGELLQIDENVAPMLLNIGMHCLGCPSSQMETIAEAASKAPPPHAFSSTFSSFSSFFCSLTALHIPWIHAYTLPVP